jgi:hypothetical protein
VHRFLSAQRPVRASLCLAGLAPIALAGCGDDRVRNEAMLFFDRYERIDQEQPPAVRRPLVEALEGLTLVTPDVVHARDACVEAHTMLLEAEERHAAAREELLAATEGGERPLEVDAAARIEAAIEESNAAIERSPALFERCYREVRSLEGRFHRRRNSER